MTDGYLFGIIKIMIEDNNMKKKIKKNSKSYKVISLFSRLVALLLVLAIVATIAFVIYMNIIPTKYIIIIVAVLIIVMGCTIFVLVSNKVRAKWKLILSLMSLMIIGLIALGLSSGVNTLDFLKKLASKDYMTENYYVIVLKNSIYANLEDLDNSNINIYDNNSEGIELVIEDLTNQINTNITKSIDLTTMTSELLNNQVEAIVMESSYKRIVDEQDENFKNNTKVIYTISVRVPVKTTLKEVGITSEPFILYICGVDTYGAITSVSRSDVNIIATINPKTKQVLLTSIPRDYYVQLHGTKGYKDKLTHAGIYGINSSLGTIEDLLDIDINYYAKVNFDSLIKIIDVLGGINVYSKKAFSTPEYRFTSGYNFMNGKKALSFSRERHAFRDGDRSRGENQEAVIEAIINKVSSPAILTKYNSILNSLEGSFETNVNSQNIKKLVKMQLDDMAEWQISSANLDGKDSSNYTYTFGQQMLYVMEPNQESIDNAKKMINKVKQGEILED